MKYLLSLLAFFCLTHSLFAQEKKSIPNHKLLKIQGGYLYDYGNSNSNNGDNIGNYSGFNVLSVGIIGVKDTKRLQGFDLDLAAYEIVPNGTNSNWQKAKISAEINLYKSFAVFGDCLIT